MTGPGSSGLRVLVVGGGGREHALAWACRRSPLVAEVLSAPGNGGTGLLGENHSIEVTDSQGLVDLARERRCDLVVLGPDASGAGGVGDALGLAGIPYFGPTQLAARLESSKSFAKQLMERVGIRSARSETFDDYQLLRRYLERRNSAVVLKADGLALGKGVFICESSAEAAEVAERLMVAEEMGPAGRRLVVEERLEGEEVSLFALCDGERAVMLPSARDYKRAFDGDLGPNTGGMGGFSLGPEDIPGLEDQVLQEVVEPALAEMRRLGCPYRGCLYIGAMVVGGQPFVLEFNARFGDPEAEILLPLLPDLVPLLLEVSAGRLVSPAPPPGLGCAVGVVAAQDPYPIGKGPGGPISGIAQAEAEGALVFQMGTRPGSGGPEVSGGRVLICVGKGDDRSEARELAYRGIRQISFPEMRFRGDIAAGG